MSGFRLEKGGVLIDRETPVRATFDGATIEGFSGDTVASAHLAAGKKLIGRSFKLHRPRGIMSSGPEEANGLVTLGDGPSREPNLPATMLPLQNKMAVESQNRWPSLDFDFLSINQLAAPFLSAGFYYKTFMGPTRKSWMFYEHLIRKAAGMGTPGREADDARYEHSYVFCDVLVVGSGPAGLLAARVASQAGLRVTLAEERNQFGGSLLGSNVTIDGKTGADWVTNELNTLRSNKDCLALNRTTVYGYYDDNTLAAVERVYEGPAGSDHRPRQRHYTIRAKSVILACGSFERPAIFENNDVPGVMLAGAVRDYARLYGVSAGKDVVFYGGSDKAIASAIEAAEAGVPVKSFIDPRSTGESELAAKLKDYDIAYQPGQGVLKATGGKSLSGITVAQFNAKTGRLASSGYQIECDCLAVSGGFTPAIHLASQQGGKPVYDEELDTFLPGDANQNWIAIGAGNGTFELENALDEALAAVNTVAAASGRSPSKTERPALSGNLTNKPKSVGLATAAHDPAKGKKYAFVDMMHDVNAADVTLANDEGFRSVEHLKRYTTLGMACDQGKTSNMNGLALMAAARGQSIPETGTTRFRAPYTPVSIGAIAGRGVRSHLAPVRRTAMHDWHVANGGLMTPVGQWYRPRAYLKDGESLHDAYTREAKAVRNSVGIVDVSTLGKIDIQGPDASTLIDRVYANGFKTVTPGKARYGIMLREDGFVYDDGTTWRLDDHHYLMTTTTAHAAGVLQMLEFWLANDWPDLKVRVNSVTDQWAGVAVAGPNSAKLLSSIVSGIDFSEEELPFMGVREGTMDGYKVYVARLSFSGERAYEVYSPADFGQAMWDAIIEAGKQYDIVPYGLEAMAMLRIEKGHVAGAELNGRVAIGDIGLGRMAAKKKAYVGKAMAGRPALHEEDRFQLVGLVATGKEALSNGAHLVTGSAENPGPSEGHITSMGYSNVKEAWIGLGYLKNGRNRHGEIITVTDPVRGKHTKAEVTDPVFYDPKGERLYA